MAPAARHPAAVYWTESCSTRGPRGSGWVEAGSAKALAFFGPPGFETGVLRAYRQRGLRLCGELSGEYAFALWDAERERLVVGCDPFVGKVVFRRDGRRLVIARTARAVLEQSRCDVELDRDFLLAHLTVGSSPSTGTSFRGVRRVAPGTVHVFTRTQDFAHRWWTPRANPEIERLSPPEQLTAFRGAVRAAVEARVPATGDCAVLLSGGLDSSILAASAAPILASTARRLVAVSNVPPKSDKTYRDEQAWAAATAAQLGIPIRFASPTTSLIAGLDDAFDRSEAFDWGLLQWAFMRGLAGEIQRAGCRTALFGIGGEIVATNAGDAVVPQLFRAGRWRAGGQVVRARSEQRATSLARSAARDVLFPYLPGKWQAHLRRLSGRPAASAFANVPLAAAARPDPMSPRTDAAHAPVSLQQDAQRLVRFTQGRLDAARALEGVGVRLSLPFLDPRVVDAGLAVDLDFQTYRGLRRGLARHAFENDLPRAVVERTEKRPFAPDHHDKVRAEASLMRAFVAERRDVDLVREWVDVEAVDAALRGASRTQPTESSPVDPLLLVGQGGAALTAFLDWFTRFRAQIGQARRDSPDAEFETSNSEAVVL